MTDDLIGRGHRVWRHNDDGDCWCAGPLADDAQESARTMLRIVLKGIDSSESYQHLALAIREELGLCQTTGCPNVRLDSLEADGYCAECLED